MGNLRSNAVLTEYLAVLSQLEGVPECPLCNRPSLVEFTHWRIIKNDFPYDKVAHTHHMVLPKRHTSDDELTPEELSELRIVKRSYINETYDYLQESVTKTSSIPHHFHLHLIVVRDDL